jgi:hypothetical protein
MSDRESGDASARSAIDLMPNEILTHIFRRVLSDFWIVAAQKRTIPMTTAPYSPHDISYIQSVCDSYSMRNVCSRWREIIPRDEPFAVYAGACARSDLLEYANARGFPHLGTCLIGIVCARNRDMLDWLEVNPDVFEDAKKYRIIAANYVGGARWNVYCAWLRKHRLSDYGVCIDKIIGHRDVHALRITCSLPPTQAICNAYNSLFGRVVSAKWFVGVEVLYKSSIFGDRFQMLDAYIDSYTIPEIDRIVRYMPNMSNTFIALVDRNIHCGNWKRAADLCKLADKYTGDNRSV